MTKRMMIVAAVAVLAVPAMAQAQSSQVTATATVANYSTVSGTGDLAFGTLSRTVDTTINPAGGANAAQRTVHFNHNVRVRFTNVPTHLTAGGGTLQLAVALTCAARLGAGAWGSAASCAGAQFNLDVGTSLTQATLGFGGTITAVNAANAVAGNYSATFDIVVEAR
jgi:hypothetical protein